VGLNDVSKGTIPEADWAVQYKALLVDMKATGATVIACTMFWGGIKDTHPNYAKYLRFNAIIAAAATATGATVADLWTATSNCDACISQAEQISYFSPHYHGDNFHPSDAGHALIAETIFSVVAGAAHGPKSFLHFPIALDGT
jgi:lysophospholipase L1-like esterase